MSSPGVVRRLPLDEPRVPARLTRMSSRMVPRKGNDLPYLKNNLLPESAEGAASLVAETPRLITAATGESGIVKVR